jgi:hypothetical protein
MQVAEQAAKIGKQGLFHVEKGFKTAVIIQDVREVFGRLDYNIRPADGIGNLWVSSERVTLLMEGVK